MLNSKKLSVSVNLASASGRCVAGRPSLPTSGLTSLSPSRKYSQTQAQRCTRIHSHSRTCKYLHAHTLTHCVLTRHIPACPALHIRRLAHLCACTLGFNHLFPVSFPFTLALLPHLSSFLFAVSLCPCISDSLCLSLSLCLFCCSPTLACISFLGPNYAPTQDSPCLGIH